MSNIFKKLQGLQDVLSQKYVLENDLREVPRHLRMKEDVLNRLKKNFVDLNQIYGENQSKIIRLREEFALIEESRAELEQRMDLIRTQREYEALNKEINEFVAQEQAMRRQIQNEENRNLEISEKLKADENVINLQEEEIKEEKVSIQALMEEKKAEIALLEERERDIIPDMDPEMLYKFDRILRNKGGRGIVPISQGICNGCFMILPAQFMNDVRSSENVHFCPYCSRILFYDEEAAAGERVGTGVLDYDSNEEDEIEGLTDLVDDDDFADF